MSKVYLCLLLSFCLVSAVSGQTFEYRFHTYGTSEGLSSMIINDIEEGEYGFMWAATDNGLCRFDAYSFKVFKEFSLSKEVRGNTQVNTLLKSPEGNIWVGTDRSLYEFDVKNNVFSDLLQGHEIDPLYITSLALSNSDELWIGTDTGLFLYKLSDKSFQGFRHDLNDETTISNTSIFDVYVDSQDRVWIATMGGGLNLYKPESNSFEHFRNRAGDKSSISSDVLRDIAELPDGRLIIGTEGDGLNVMDVGKGSFEQYNFDKNDSTSLSSTSAYSFLVDEDENLWVGTWANGLNLFDINTGKARHFINNPDDSYSIPNNVIRCISQSSSGDIWLGTDGGGLSRLNLEEQKIVRYRHNSKKSNSLSKNFVRSVLEDENGKLWIGTGQGGLNFYDPQTERFRTFLQPDETRDKLARSTIWSMSEGQDNILWLGTSRGVARFNRLTEEIVFNEPDENNPNSPSGNNVLKVLDDKQGGLWLGMWYGGLNRIDIETGINQRFFNDPTDGMSLASNNVNEIYIDRQNRVWVGTDHSFSLLLPDGHSFQNYDYTTFMINEDLEGNLWLCTSQGLLKFDPDTQHFESVLSKDDQIGTGAKSVLIDSAGTIWICTDQGISRYEPESGEIRHFSQSDGLADNAQMSRAATIGPSGKIYSGGIGGLSQIDPEIVEFESSKFDLRFTDFLLFNRSVPVSDSTALLSSLSTLEKLTLNYTDYIFAFEFAATLFSSPDEVTYAYTLTNFDKEWISTNYVNRKAVYTNVPPGDYTLKVRASHIKNKSVVIENSIDITIIPPWWQTWWAKLLLYSGIVVFGLIAFQVRVSVIRRQKEVLEQEVKLRTREVTEQKSTLEKQAMRLEEINHQKDKLFSIISHDLRNPLATLKGTMALLDPKILKEEELDEIRKDIGDRIDNLSGTIINLLDWAKGQMEGELVVPETIDLYDLCEHNLSLFESTAIKKNITVSNNIPKGTVVFADANQISSVMRNLIGNALKFTSPGDQIDIAVQPGAKEAIISVSDTGRGMDQSKIESLFSIATNLSTTGTAGEKGVGLGMVLIKEFIEKNNGKLWVESQLEKGSTFYFSLPVV